MSDERPTGWEEADRWFSDDAGGDGGGDGEGPGEEGPPPVPRCDVCGAELEPDQTYCLECGSPTPLAPRLRRGGRVAALVAAAMVVLGLGAGALAYAVASDDDGGSSTTTSVTAPTGTGPVVPPPLTGPLPPDTSFTTPTAPTVPTDTTGTVTGFPTVTGPTTPTAPATTDGTTTAETQTGTEPEPTPTPDPDTAGSDWPAGETAWTAVLSSVRSESDARAGKTRLAAAGEPAGVLFSSDHPGLQPGYWVLFSGSYPAQAGGGVSGEQPELRVARGLRPPHRGLVAADPVIVITGASSGIGAATARAASAAGYRVVLAARRFVPLGGLARELGGPERALAVACDVTEWDDQQRLVAEALERFGRIDAVFANAGFGAKRGFLQESPEHWREMVLTNVYGAALSVRASVEALRESRGHLLLIGSVAGRKVVPGSLYSCTKWAVTAMAEAARQDLHGSGVRVTLLSPGTVETPFYDEPVGGAQLTPEDVAEAAMFALGRPPHVDVNEILVRPTVQDF